MRLYEAFMVIPLEEKVRVNIGTVSGIEGLSSEIFNMLEDKYMMHEVKHIYVNIGTLNLSIDREE